MSGNCGDVDHPMDFKQNRNWIENSDVRAQPWLKAMVLAQPGGAHGLGEGQAKPRLSRRAWHRAGPWRLREYFWNFCIIPCNHTWTGLVPTSMTLILIHISIWLIWNICPPLFQAWQCQWHCSVSHRWDNGRITVTWRGGGTQNRVGGIFVKHDLSLHGTPWSLCSTEHLDCLPLRK